VSVASVIQHVKRMRHIVLSSVACPALPYFSTKLSLKVARNPKVVLLGTDLIFTGKNASFYIVIFRAVTPNVKRRLSLFLFLSLCVRARVCVCVCVQSHSDIAPPKLCSRESLWIEISYYIVVGFMATLDTAPQIAVNKEWHYIEV
jgi:hypothetical protein